MYAGFDYGTSHCALGVWRDQAVSLVQLEEERPIVPSTLHAPKVALNLPRTKQGTLRLDSSEFGELRFGDAALNEYLSDPTRGYFVKSPKSFLGVAGLSEDIRERFVTVIGAMMANVKLRADRQLASDLDQDISAVVIGRPVNFQGLGGADANAQSLSMLEEAARLAGFSEVVFQYEPMAAALEYESRWRRRWSMRPGCGLKNKFWSLILAAAQPTVLLCAWVRSGVSYSSAMLMCWVTVASDVAVTTTIRRWR